MPRNERTELINQIEQARKSRVVAFVCSDRTNAVGQITEDCVRVMYDLIRSIGHVPRLDLYLYSLGGSMDVPWRIVCMLREHCEHLGVLIPYRANSAATLIALGCDEVVMGKKAELGAIDPAFPMAFQVGSQVVQDEIRVEDVMAYMQFLTEKAGVKSDESMGNLILSLADKITPWRIGTIYRTHSHIRAVAEKMLACHKKPIPEANRDLIIRALAEETRSHGHGLSRREAKELELDVSYPDEGLNDMMWCLCEEFETASKMRDPIDPLTTLGVADEAEVPVIAAWLESLDATWAHRGMLKFKRTRAAAGKYEVKVSFGFNLNLNPPAGVNLQNIDPQAMSALQQDLMNQLQQHLPQQLQGVPDQVKESVRLQSPTANIERRMVGKWEDVTSEGI
jgi:hypothetical protein